MNNELNEYKKQLIIEKYKALADEYNNEEVFERNTPKERTKLIGKRLASLRKLTDLTQKEVSEAIGISPQTYAGYESGRHEPNVETLIRLSFFYGVSMDDITCKYSNTLLEQERPEVYLEYNDYEHLEQLRIEVGYLNSKLEELDLRMKKDLSQNLSPEENKAKKQRE